MLKGVKLDIYIYIFGTTFFKGCIRHIETQYAY